MSRLGNVKWIVPVAGDTDAADAYRWRQLPGAEAADCMGLMRLRRRADSSYRSAAVFRMLDDIHLYSP